MALKSVAFTMDASKLLVGADGTTSFWLGGRGHAGAFGTFGGGTLAIQGSPDAGTTKVTLGTDVTWTANGLGNFLLPQGYTVYATLTGSTTPSITVYYEHIGIEIHKHWSIT